MADIKLAMNRAKLQIQKNSPEIMLVGGIILNVGALVWSCIKTTKVKEIVDEHDRKIKDVKETYSEEEKPYKKELTKVYLSTAGKFAKNYALPAVLEASSMALMIGSHNVLYGRNLALTAACAAFQDRFKDYSKILPKEDVPEIVENKMKEASEDEKKETINKASSSIYARTFDRNSANWVPGSMYYNFLFLKNQQNYFNDLLNSRGHVFLNEVYDALDVKRNPNDPSSHSKAGAVVGWVKGSGHDDFVDFGIDFSCLDKYGIDDFPYDDGRSGIALDFNVDGVIYDLI